MFPRRYLFRLFFVLPLCDLCAFVVISSPLHAAPPALTVEVSETAGLRRFGYPVEAVLELPAPPKEGTRYRLLDDKGKPVPAQFRPLGGRKVALDFNINLGPEEKRTFAVEYGPDVEPGPEPKGGLKLEQTDSDFVIRNGSLAWSVPRDLLGLVRSLKSGKNDYLRPGSQGLMIWYKDGIPFRAGGKGPDGEPTKGKVVRSGPLAVSLRFEGTEALRGGRSVPSVVELTFPSSKSWVRVDWTVDDPNGYVAGLGADLNLNVGDGPTLVDFGIGVYTHLRDGQQTRWQISAVPLPHGPKNRGESWRHEWEILQGTEGKMESLARQPAPAPFMVVAPRRWLNPRDGWAHVMDRQRCTALAVDRFAGAGGEIVARADGHLHFWQYFQEPRSRERDFWSDQKRHLTFWLHFVPSPPQVGALTSPQSMLAPLKVEVRPR